MSNYSAIYYTTTGEITVVALTTEIGSPGIGYSLFAGDADSMTEYLPSGVLTARPVVTEDEERSLVADGIDIVTIALPDGTLVTDLDDGTDYTSSGTENFTVTSVITGEFEFLLEPPFPYQIQTITITADTAGFWFTNATYSAADIADDLDKGPGVIADFRNARFAITDVATASIAAATAEAVGEIDTCTLADVFTFTRSSTKYVKNVSGTYESIAVDAVPYDYTNSVRQFLLEGAATNSVLNNSMQGAVAGTPGTAPTNWNLNYSSGISRQIVGTGTENGVEYIDVRWFGTASGATNWLVYTQAANTIAALQSQTWRNSYFLSLRAGTIPSTVYVGMDEYNAALSWVAGGSTTATITATLSRHSYSRTLTAATTAWIRTYLVGYLTNGQVVDFTLRIGWPQVEQNASASSPIRTTSAAVTRAADSCQLTAKALAVLARTAAGAVVQGQGTYGTVARTLVGGNAGTFVLRANPSSYVLLGSSTIVLVAAASPLPTFGAAGAWNGSGKALSYLGSTIATDAVAMDATLTAAYLGRDSTGVYPANGWYDQFTIYPFKPTNADLVEKAVAYA